MCFEFPNGAHMISFNLFGGIFENIILSSISHDEKNSKYLYRFPNKPQPLEHIED